MKTLSALISAATLVLTIPGSWGFQNDSLAQTHSTAFRDADVLADQKDSHGLLSRRKETAGPPPVRSTARSSPVGNRHQRSPSRPVAVKGPFLWPTGGKAEVVRRFDPPAQRWLSGHRGVDLDAQEGSTIFAAGAGTVAFAGRVAEKNVVSIDHGSLRTTYEPVTPLVSAGDIVKRETPSAHSSPVTVPLLPAFTGVHGSGKIITSIRFPFSIRLSGFSNDRPDEACIRGFEPSICSNPYSHSPPGAKTSSTMSSNHPSSRATSRTV